MRAFVSERCGLVAPTAARCHCCKRVPAAVQLGRIDPAVAEQTTPAELNEAVAEMEALYDAAGLLRSVPDAVAPDEVAVRIRTLLDSGRYRLIAPPP